MGVPEARLNRSQKGSRLCLNSTRQKDISGEIITVPDSTPSSPELRNQGGNNLFTQTRSLERKDSSQTMTDTHSSVGDNSNGLAPPGVPVASFYNLGNTCFMNCMLHVLRFTPEFLQLLEKLRLETEAEEEALTSQKEMESEKWDGSRGLQLLRNLHDMYTEMALKESHYRHPLPTSSGDMALRPYALLDSIRHLNPLFEGNMQHDAQELLRCLLSGLDDAELELRRVKQKRLDEQEQPKKSDPDSVHALEITSRHPTSSVVKGEANFATDVKKAAKKQPALKGGRSRGRKKEEVSNASKDLLASFLKAKEVPATMTRLDKQHEIMESLGIDKDSAVCVTATDEMEVSFEGIQSGSDQSCKQLPSWPQGQRSSQAFMCGSDGSQLPDIIFDGESKLSSESISSCFNIEKTSSITVSSSSSSLSSSSSHPNCKKTSSIKTSSSPPPSPSSSSSSTVPGHEGYLTSVKYTEGRRSRLGVRGQAKSIVVSDEKWSAPVSYRDAGDGCQQPAVGVMGNVQTAELSQEENSMTDKVNQLDSFKSRASQLDCLSAGISSSQRLSLPKKLSPCSSQTDVDKIVEMPPLHTKAEHSPVTKSGGKFSDSPHLQAKADEEKPLFSEGGPSLLLLTPGKEITIHSPLELKASFYTPPLPKSRNFLSRLGHLLPSSAKRFLSFSSEDSPRARKTSLNVLSSPSLEVSSCEPTALIKLSVSSVHGLSRDQVEECVREAQIQLRRCDWLGVSPVKAVSARQVMRQISNSGLDNSSEMKIKEAVSGGPSGDSCFKSHATTSRRKRSLSGDLVSSTGDDVEAKNVATVGEGTNQTSISGRGFDGDMFTDSASKVKTSISKAKRFKSNQGSRTESNVKVKSETMIDVKHLPKLSISLEKCDWLIHASKQSVNVKVSSVCKQSLKIPQKTESLSASLRPEEKFPASLKVEAPAPSSSTASTPSSASGQPLARLVYNLFGGTMSHHTRCCECESISDRSEEFLDISVPVPKPSSASGDNSDDHEAVNSCDKSASPLLHSLAGREKIYGENKYFCGGCHHLVEAERSSHLTALPKVLTLHLKRFHANSSAFGGVAKINDHVTVPIRLPCLLHRCARTPSVCLHGYSLYAIVTHSGASIRHGHYRTYVKVSHSFSHIADYKGDKLREPSSPRGHVDLPSAFAPSDAYLPFPLNNRSCESSKENSLPVKSSSSFATSEKNSFLSALPPDVTPSTKGDGDRSSCWWLECDDDYIQVFEEEEFLGKLSQTDGYLLGTPYVLFYHQTHSQFSAQVT